MFLVKNILATTALVVATVVTEGAAALPGMGIDIGVKTKSGISYMICSTRAKHNYTKCLGNCCK